MRRKNFSLEAKNLIQDLKGQGLSTGQIAVKLKTLYNYDATRFGIYKFLQREKKGSVNRKKRPTKFMDIHKQLLHMWMSENRDRTARDIQKKFEKDIGISFSLSTIKMHRSSLNWTVKQKSYCQLISHKNQLFRVTWCLNNLTKQETFEDVIFVDESNVELNAAGRLSFYQSGVTLERLPRKVAKPKHSYTVHVWAGISYKGRTNICIFTGIMDSIIYQKILADNLLPFVKDKFPDGYRLYQDNDSKHKSKSTKKWMEENGVAEHVMTTPASSPDLNPIEFVWSAMKNFLQREVKPKTKDQLVQGIKTYWETLTAEKCSRFIDHIHKVMPVVVLNNGGPTDI